MSADAVSVIADAMSVIADTVSVIADAMSVIADTVSVIADTVSVIADAMSVIADTVSVIADAMSVIADAMSVIAHRVRERPPPLPAAQTTPEQATCPAPASAVFAPGMSHRPAADLGQYVEWSKTMESGNEGWKVTKQGAGELLITGLYDMVDNGDFVASTAFLDVTAGTVKVGGASGRMIADEVRVNGGTFTGGSGTFEMYIQDTSVSIIDFNSGAVDISTLTVDFTQLGLGATQSSYVLVDYSDAGSSNLTLATNGATGNTFGGVVDLPTGYSIVNDTANNQVLLTTIPEPASLALLGMGGLCLIGGRSKRRA